MTAKDLLYLVLDYRHLWAAPEVQQSRPAKIRLQQIECLANVFGLNKESVNPSVKMIYSFVGSDKSYDRAQYLEQLTPLEYLLTGEFLNDRPKSENREISERVDSKIEDPFKQSTGSTFQKPTDLKWMFTDLLNYRQEIYRLTYPNQGMLEGFSAGLYYSFYLQGQLQKVIKNNLSEIDDTLWLLLDPQKREFDKESIGFPVADLKKIDLDWRMDNY